MLKEYECIFVLDPAITDEQKESIVQKVRSIITSHKGEVEKVEDWGKRELAYHIKGKTHGLYLWFGLKEDPKFISELESNFKLDERVLRQLTLVRQKKPETKIRKVAKITAGRAEEGPVPEGTGEDVLPPEERINNMEKGGE